MSEIFEEGIGKDKLKAAHKAERRENRHKRAKNAPVPARYGIWTGESLLREGEGLERRLALESLKPLSGIRSEKRRKRKKKT